MKSLQMMLLWLCKCGWYGTQPEKTLAGEHYCPECRSRSVRRVQVVEKSA
jgi:hypothetical protein